MDVKDYIAQEKFTDLKTQRKAIERAYRKGRLSLDFYNSSVTDLDQQIQNCESEIATKSEGKHFVIELCCPCGQRGNVTYGKMDFKLLGKDRKGFIYFECPNCKKHLQYDLISGAIKIRRSFLMSLVDIIKNIKLLALMLVLSFMITLYCDKSLAIEQVRFHSKVNGYSFAIPEGWIQIPEDIVQQNVKNAVSAKTATIIKYEAIFQLVSQEHWLEHPLIIINVVKYSDLGLSRRPLPNEFVYFVKALTGYDATDVKKAFTNQKIKDAIGEVNIGQAVVDKYNFRYKFTTEIERTDIKKYDKYDFVGYFGKEIIVQISFTCQNSSDWDKFKADRDYIFGSFNFDPSMAYRIALNPRRQPVWEKILADVAIYGILALVITLIGLVNSVFKAKKRNDFKDEQEKITKQEIIKRMRFE